MKNIIRGFKAGVPIGLGYLSVSFTFGIMAVSYGLSWWQATIISMLTVTSAGQFAGIGIMLTPGRYFEMLVSQITINLRYSFMSISLSQKTDDRFSGIHRWILGFMMTDEIFAVASNEEKVSKDFFIGLCILPYLGWSLGTLAGAVLGNVLPGNIMSALGIAIYGMFIAIVVPEVKQSKHILFVVVLAIIFSCCFYYIPILQKVSGGLAISICAILSAGIGALLFPISNNGGTAEN